MLVLRAAFVAPIVEPVITDGAVVIEDGRIRAIGMFADVRPHLTGAVTDLGEVVLTPALVNAHTHLELSNCTPPPACDFATWLRRIIESRMAAGLANLEASTLQAVRAGIERSLHFGVGTVGDIGRYAAWSRPILAEGPLQAVSFGEVQAFGGRRTMLDLRLDEAMDDTWASPRLHIGLSPHAPYTVEPAAYTRCLQEARRRSLPLCTHLAETPHEAALLAEHAGPLRQLWDWLGGWDEEVPRVSGGPVRLAAELGLLNYPTLLAHVNYCDDAELELLAHGHASVVWCPRTHAYFAHPPHRWRDMLARGINVAVGTDSCASSPDLNPLDDLRLLHRLSPEVPADDLWRLITVNAARAMGFDDAGRLAIGAAADVAVFPAGADPLMHLLENDALPCGLYLAGRRVF